MKILKCYWFKCEREFTPTHNRQRYCRPECRNDARRWAQSRGAALVWPLVSGDAVALLNLRRKLLKEINK